MGFVLSKVPLMKPKLGRLPFGKYQGQLITEIAVADPKYLHWLLEQTWLQKHLRILICKALDIDEILLRQVAHSSPSRKFNRRIERPEQAQE
jgi:uncharacterized protein (DUF3820 family)